jgi:leucyl aminopeptidase
MAKDLWVSKDGVGFEKMPESNLSQLAIESHKDNKYCGGFIALDEIPARAQKVLNFNQYSISRNDLVKPIISQVSELRLRNFIKKFSSYHTRYYTSTEGVKAAKDLKADWSNLASHRNDVQVELYQHRSWPQPSVMATIKGSSNKYIIIGGHLDSINTDDEGNHSHAPGADDNASGISVLTETFKLLMENNYKSTHNIIFFGYAAEEVGLRGSFEIAERYSNLGKQILGVLQIDGTNFNGSRKKIVLIDDYTDQSQNRFLGRLIDQYVKVPWGYDSCHYACSDHYPWTYNGFPASFPAEAYIEEENPHIHTAKDTIEVSNNRADHAVHFTKLSLAYLIEMDK